MWSQGLGGGLWWPWGASESEARLLPPLSVAAFPLSPCLPAPDWLFLPLSLALCWPVPNFTLALCLLLPFLSFSFSLSLHLLPFLALLSVTLSCLSLSPAVPLCMSLPPCASLSLPLSIFVSCSVIVSLPAPSLTPPACQGQFITSGSRE